MQILKTSHYTLTVGGASALLTYATPTASRHITGPTFEGALGNIQSVQLLSHV